ncbi:PLDc N-terminal domain-containing protein [Candidatus Woesearchaeota archaeon]|nr:PLDc N-terminal domain-containing protein [Candidatus Woesearchaeota archaeon]
MMKKTISIGMLMALLLAVSVAALLGQNNNILISDNNNVKITMINQEPDPVQPGDYLRLRFRVENIGISGADHVMVELVPKYPFYLDPSETASRDVSALDGWQVDEEGVVLDWRIRVDENAVEGEEEISIKYKVGNSPWVVYDFDVEIRTPDTLLAIDSITTSPARIEPGQFTDLNVKVKNLADSRLMNLKFNLDLTDVAIAPVGTSNEQTLLDLKAKENKTVQFRIVADSDAESKVYKVPMTISYRDETGRNFTTEHTIGVVVYGTPEYFVNVEESDTFMSGSKGNVVLSISNTGAAELKYVSIELEQNDNYTILTTPKIYIGNIDSDDVESVDFTISTNKVKDDIPLKVVLEYKDTYNKYFREKIDVPLKIYSGREAAMYGLVQKGSPVTALFGLSILVLLGVFWYYNLRHCLKNKKNDEKVLWLIVIIGGTLIGSVVYYFIGRKKKVA